ncbi:MAG: serine/threonine protein kinase [Steroidobacteraceae bacterium]
MSVEPIESMGEAWTRWQGHLINGVFPLGRYLGCSDHSGVFLTESAARRPSLVAVKLVPANRDLAESLLPRWKRAGGLAHPQLLRLWEWGGCQLDGLPYLYALMEYADQTLAQLLLRRALTDTEAREMLLPILDALAFLHHQDLVQGRLKPANILVVGDQLKLASDTIRRVNESARSTNPPHVYDPPEARRGSTSTADDIWALGVSLFEALTRRAPSGLGESNEAVALPADFSEEFRDVVARCLSPSPQERPTVTELMAWAGGRSAGSAPAATLQQAALVPPEPASSRTAPPRVAPEAARRPPSMALSVKPRALLAVMLAATVIFALGWTGVRMFRTDHTSAPPSPHVEIRGGSRSHTPGAATPAAAQVRAPVSAISPTTSGRSDLAASQSVLHEVIPDVPWSARRTIRGHIKVWVRVIVDRDGSVAAALADRTGPSRYFERLAIEAAKKWTFSPVDTPSRRLIQVRFEFSRHGTTGRAVTLR